MPEPFRTNYQSFIARGIGPLVKDASWQAPTNEPADASLRRITLLGVLAVDGRDHRLSDEAKRLAVAWLSDRQAVAPDAVETVLGVAARNADERLFDQLLSEARNAKDPADRQTLLNAVGSTVDIRFAERALEALVAKAFSPVEARTLLTSLAGNRSTRASTYE